jgi:hypothetical protein
MFCSAGGYGGPGAGVNELMSYTLDRGRSRAPNDLAMDRR